MAAQALYERLLANYEAGHPKSEVILDRDGNLRVSAIGHATQIAVNADGALTPSV